MKKNTSILLFLSLFCVGFAFAQGHGHLKMSEYYSDHMVLQRNIPLVIDGESSPLQQVRLTIDDKQYSTTADADGQWSIPIEPLSADETYTLTVSTPTETLRFNHVLAGELWLCSGQSNMEFMLKQTPITPDELAQINDSALRLFDMKAAYRTNHVKWSADILDSIQIHKYYSPTKWSTATSQAAAEFSAIAYYFGKMLRDSLNVPVGLICNAVGGSPTESWIEEAELKEYIPSMLNDWKNNELVQDWVRQRGMYNIANAQRPNQQHPYMPSYLFTTGIKPFLNVPIKGVIWYQGESNAQDAITHNLLFKLLVDNWRTAWGNTQLPFYYVQLSSLNRDTWPQFRDSQRRLLDEISNIGMVVSSDKGDSLDVHPVNKQPIGWRLGLMALRNTYHHNVVASGPLFKHALFSPARVIVTFENGEGLNASDGGTIRGFEIAGKDGIFYKVSAVVKENSVILSHGKVVNPQYVRYGWEPYTTANLINGAGLPASTFYYNNIQTP